MIAQLRGRIVSRQPNNVIIDVGGVGYGVHIPLSTFTQLQDVAGETTLLTYTHVTQDSIQLYGFATIVEKHLFLLLITVNGVGPRLASSILSGIAPEELAAAIERKDEARLIMVPGIGKKTAARLIIDLHDKVRKVPLELKPGEVAPTRGDLVSALMNLGYTEPRAARAVELAIADSGTDAGFELLLKRALAAISK